MRAKVTVTGGKGGTGKSTVAVNLALALSGARDVTLGDLDVEAPNDHILMGVQLENEEPVEIMLPFISYSKCEKCGACGRICDTGAIMSPVGKYPVVFPRLCSGCRACFFGCPYDAIVEGKRVLGYTYSTWAELGGGLKLVTGVLREGEEHSSPVVTAARKRAEGEAEDLLLVDTAAGTGNNVSIALSGSDLVIVVTEPTPLGAHDLSMILDLVEDMGLEAWIVLNRSGIGDERVIEKVIGDRRIKIAEKIPYSEEIVRSYIKGKPIVLDGGESSRPFLNLAERILEVV